MVREIRLLALTHPRVQSVQQYLQCAQQCVEELFEGNSVFIQHAGPVTGASDATISSIVQVVMDPFFRTLPGFCILLWKEWFISG